MARLSGIALSAVMLLVLAGCGGGGGGGGLSTDADPNQTPAVDASYHNVPSTPLGAIVEGSKVTFNFWNATASSVTVNLYANWNDPLATPAATIALTKGAGGIWTSGSVNLPAQNFYVYKVGDLYMLDPYARSMAQWVGGASSIPGDSTGKAAILDPSLTGPDGGWTPYTGSSYYFDGSKMKATDGVTAAPYAYASNRDAIIYEAGVRDLTVDPALSGFAAGHTWGTFKALVDMLPHIQKLGVTHIQLLCPLENFYYDQSHNNVREMDTAKVGGANYNWGYDPQSYFTPSGMYSAAPLTPEARINELKTLVNEIHKAGMGVILDVVYNHTANDSILSYNANGGYFYRDSSKNGAGSHDVRTEHKMTRKLIVDSVNQWVTSYRVDGFRFDLMGVLDTETVKAAYAAATAANPKTIFIGEGWNGFFNGSGSDYMGTSISGSDQTHVAAFTGLNVGMFSDSYRQIFKNGYPNDGATAFLTGTSQDIGGLFSNVSGKPTNFAAPSTNNVVNYLTCHDNLCYYDVLSLATRTAKTQDAVILQRAKVGYAILLTSQGTAFLHAGDEMFRTKETTAVSGTTNTKSNGGRVFVDNSYNSSDAINMVAWSTVYSGNPIAGGFSNYAVSANGYQLYAYTQGLIAIRKSTNAFRLPDVSITGGLVSIPPTSGGGNVLAFGYKAISADSTGTYYVLHNADTVAHSFTVDASLTAALLLADGATAGLTPITSSTTVTLSADGKTVTVAPLTSAIFKL